MKHCIILAIITILVFTPYISGENIPKLQGYINDYAELLSSDTADTLTKILENHERKTGNQIYVLILNISESFSIEDYTEKVYKEWKIGQKDKDNGILILIVPNAREIRIEVGYGLEGSMTDSKAGRIINNTITPKFRAGDFNGGLTAGINDIITILEGNEASNTVSTDNSWKSNNLDNEIDIGLSVTHKILIGLFIFSILGLFTFIGIITPGMGWFFYVFLIPFWSTFPMMIIGSKLTILLVAIYLIAFPIVKVALKKQKFYKNYLRSINKKGNGNIGGFTYNSGGFSNSWFSGSSRSSGGSSSSGSFSGGGGGSSGGGGASGKW